jgi:hypothetical protein
MRLVFSYGRRYRSLGADAVFVRSVQSAAPVQILAFPSHWLLGFLLALLAWVGQLLFLSIVLKCSGVLVLVI